MKITYPGGVRETPMDRNPEAVALQWAGNGVAPHADTERDSYQPSAGRRAVIDYVHIALRRATAAAPVGLITVYATGLVGVDNLNLVWLKTLNNTVDYFLSQYSQVGVWLDSTSIVTLNTEDLSTGGTVDYTLSMFITEFDA